MFNHPLFDKYLFETIPLDRDIYLVDEKYMKEYEHELLQLVEGKGYEAVGYVTPVAARRINENSIDLTWYANAQNRWHEIAISLPRDQFISSVGCWRYDEKPRVFVTSEWIRDIHLRSYSIFALIDAIGVRSALEAGRLTRHKLIELRNKIDELSAEYPDISFISFADSLLLKSNWTIGHRESAVEYNYEPELFVLLAKRINQIYFETLKLNTYAVIAQGSNEFYGDPLLHSSKLGNHISLNSLGIPFSQIQEIELTARSSIRENVHGPADLYLDEQYYRSLKFKYQFNREEQPSNTYLAKMMDVPCRYFYTSYENIINNLAHLS